MEGKKKMKLIFHFRCFSRDFTALHAACQESGGGEDRSLVIQKLVQVTDPQVLINCTNDPEGASPFRWAMESSNWTGLKILIESDLVADRFFDKIDSWPENLLFDLSTPLATFLSTSWPDLTSEELEEFVKLFVERGSNVNGCSSSSLPPIFCKNNSERTIQFLLSHGAKLPRENLMILAAQQSCVSRACKLAKSGFLHPEFLFDERNRLGLKEMLQKSETQVQKEKIENGISGFALLESLTLGSRFNRNLVSDLFNVLQQNCPRFPEEKHSKIFDEIEKILSSPSTLKVLARASVRNCLLSKCLNDRLSRTVDSLSDTLPIELSQFLIFSDLDESLIRTLCDGF